MDELEECIQLEIDRLRAAVVAFNSKTPRRWMCKHGGLMCGPLRSSEAKEAAKRYREIRQKAEDLLRG
jgi:hypothetical protein